MNWKQIVASTGTDDNSPLADWFSFVVIWAVSCGIFLTILFGGIACLYLVIRVFV
jgi:hypothetical protein